MKQITFTMAAAALALSLTGPVTAAPRELSQSELRRVSAAGQAIGLKRVIDGVARMTGGTPIDAHAFRSGDVFYRVLVKKSNGRIESVIVNARTGKSVSQRSGVGRQIDALASKPDSGATN